MESNGIINQRMRKKRSSRLVGAAESSRGLAGRSRPQQKDWSKLEPSKKVTALPQ